MLSEEDWEVPPAVIILRTLGKNEVAGDDRRRAARRFGGEDLFVGEPRNRLEFFEIVEPHRGLDAGGCSASSFNGQLDLNGPGVSTKTACKLILEGSHAFPDGLSRKASGAKALHGDFSLGAFVSY